MTEYFPVLAAILFVVVAFIFAVNKGVVGLLASGAAIAVGIALILAGFRFLPHLARTYLDIELTWQFSLGLSAGVGGLVFIVLRVIFAFAFRRIFNADSPLHSLSDGAGGGILSLFPSIVAVFLFFTCVRAAGTVQELNYIDSLCQPGIERMGGKIPSPPPSIRWRNAIESMPFLAPLLDQTDPFSQRRARNVAALTLISRSSELRHHLLGHPDTDDFVGLDPWKIIATDPVVGKAIASSDRVALVTAPVIQKAAGDSRLPTGFDRLVFLPALRDFTGSLAPITEPEAGSL